MLLQSQHILYSTLKAMESNHRHLTGVDFNLHSTYSQVLLLSFHKQPTLLQIVSASKLPNPVTSEHAKQVKLGIPGRGSPSNQKHPSCATQLFSSVKVEQSIPTTSEGMLDGTSEGMLDGTSEGMLDGTSEAMLDGTSEGIFDGTSEGMLDGTSERTLDGTSEGMFEGTSERTFDGTSDGISDGTSERTLDGNSEGM